jgi:predicted nucleic acid-binding protein
VKRVVVDASALAAFVFQEPEGEEIKDRLTDATVFAPALLRYELANTALKKARQQPADAPRILTALAIALDASSGVVWKDVDARDVVLLAQAANLTAYDASYLWLAATLGADLVTLDKRLGKALDTLASPA